MTYNIVDLRTNKVVGSYETAEAAERAESHLVHEPYETWYEIQAPVKKRAKKTNVKKQSE